MNYAPAKHGYVLRLYKGESLMETLQRFAETQNISAGTLRGIGAVSSALFGYYDLERKTYEFKPHDYFMEVVSLQGNISLLEGKPFLHVHGAFAGKDLVMIGGHVKEAVAGLTLEIFIDTYDTAVVRRYDNDIGLNLFDLPCVFEK